jgi:hypothetical protein
VVHFDGVAAPTTWIFGGELRVTAPLESIPKTVQVSVLTYGTWSVTTLPLDYV